MLAAHWEQAHEAVIGRKDLDVAVRQVAGDQQVAERILLLARVARKRKVERRAHETMCTLCADQPGRCDSLQASVRKLEDALDRRGVVRKRILPDADQLGRSSISI
jgi:hypothetical protein